MTSIGEKSIQVTSNIGELLSKNGIEASLENWKSNLEASSRYETEEFNGYLTDWARYILRKVIYDLYKYSINPFDGSKIDNYDTFISSTQPTWYYKLDYNFWRWILDGGETGNPKNQEIKIDPLNSIDVKVVNKTKVYLFDSDRIECQLSPSEITDESWAYAGKVLLL